MYSNVNRSYTDVLKLTGKERHAPYNAISLNKANLIKITT